MLKVDSKIILSWDDVVRLVDELCERIPFEIPLADSVHGLSRGGLIPAVMVSHKLNLPYVEVIGKDTLVIDDICDSGVTLQNTPGLYTAVLHHKPETSCFTPNCWADLHVGHEWILYPWERHDSKQIQDYLNKEKNG